MPQPPSAGPGISGFVTPFTAWGFCVSVLLGLAVTVGAWGQEEAGPDDLAAKSLPLRTALHHDPTMESPLTALVAMYRKANRLEELQGMYQTHLQQWPNDASATVVLIRIQTDAADPAALRTAQTATQRFPQVGYVHYLLFELLQADRDPAAVDALDRAINLETDPARKAGWIERLLPLADIGDRRDLVEKHLKVLVELQSSTPEGLLAAARRAQSLGEHEVALAAVERGLKMSPASETMVDLELAAAEAVAGLDRVDAAGERLDALLGKLTGDYWRRSDILRRRLALVQNDEQRDKMIAAARDRVAARPGDESAVLDLANLLESFEQRRDAVAVLRGASNDLPDSMPIEQATLSLYDALRDEPGRADYLRARLEQKPGRTDVAVMLAESLFLLGQSAEAEAVLDQKLASLEAEQRTAVQLELARRLRRSSLPTEAARLFALVVEANPRRLEVMRELAELYLALNDSSRATVLLSKPLPRDAALENFLDLANFMVEHEMYREARTALAARRVTDPTNMELPVLQLAIEGAEARFATGGRIIEESRPLADTSARYRIWLEAATRFYKLLDDASDPMKVFLDAELARLRDEAEGLDPEARWSDAVLDRGLVFADVAVSADLPEVAADLLQEAVASNPPLEPRLKIRRALIVALDKAKGGEARLEEQLAALAAETPDASDEANARLAILFHRAEQATQVEKALKRVDLNRVNDPTVLADLEGVYAGRNDRAGVAMVIRRLTQTDPTNRDNWSRHVTLLALQGDEDGLRTTLRRLLAGVDRMPVKEEVRGVIESHLLESYWRSVSGKLARLQAAEEEGGDVEAELAETLYLLDSASRVARTDRSALWTAWTRGYVLNRLGRGAERDEAIAELERLAESVRAAEGEAEASHGGGEGAEVAEGEVEEEVEGVDVAGAEGLTPAVSGVGELMIPFPDGLQVSMSGAREVLTAEASDRVPTRLLDAAGPVPADGRLETAWTFQTPGGAAIVAIFPLEKGGSGVAPAASPAGEAVGEGEPATATAPGGSVLVFDAAGRLSRVDLSTGKMLWSQEEAGPRSNPGQGETRPVMHPSGHYMMGINVPGTVVRPVLDEAGRLWLGWEGAVTCMNAVDGSVLWRAGLAKPVGEEAGPMSVEVVGERGVVYSPGEGRVWVLDAATGKLLDSFIVGGGAGAAANADELPLPLSWLNSGMSSDDGRTLVYGSSAAVIDTATGRLRWSFAADGGALLPIRLDEPDEEGAKKTTGSAGGSGATTTSGSSGASHYMGGPVLFSPHVSTLHVNTLRGGYPGYGGGGSALQPAVVTRIPTSSRTGLESVNLSLLRQGRLQLVPPAAAWADAKSLNRLGLLQGPRLLLLSSGPVNQGGALQGYLTRLDLPVVGGSVSVDGTFLGVSGRLAVFLRGTSLNLLDLNTGSVRTCDVSAATMVARAQQQPLVPSATPQPPAPATTGVVDGPVAYVTGDGGVICVNLSLAKPIYTAPWSAALADRLTTEPMRASYAYRGITLSPIGPDGATPTNDNGQTIGITRPPIDRVVPGMLLTSPRPGLLIAVRAAAADSPG